MAKSLTAVLQSVGVTLQTAAADAGVQPLLLQRIEAAMQPMPRSLAVRIAQRYGLDTVTVFAACRLTTELTGPLLLEPIPPRPGETAAPARLSPTLARP